MQQFLELTFSHSSPPVFSPLFLNSSAFSHLPLSFHGSGSWALWKLLLRDCLQPQTLPAQFQGKGKAIPCLGHSESVSVSSASWCPQITFPHPIPSRFPISLCCSVIREWESISPRSETRMRFTCSLTVLSPLMSFTSVRWHLQFPTLQWNSILHAGVVTAYSYNIPSPLSIRLHEASCHSMMNTLDSALLPQIRSLTLQ